MAEASVVPCASHDKKEEMLEKRYTEVFRPLIDPLLGPRANPAEARKVISFLEKLPPAEHVQLVWYMLDRLSSPEIRFLSRNLIPHFPNSRPRLVK